MKTFRKVMILRTYFMTNKNKHVPNETCWFKCSTFWRCQLECVLDIRIRHKCNMEEFRSKLEHKLWRIRFRSSKTSKTISNAYPYCCISSQKFFDLDLKIKESRVYLSRTNDLHDSLVARTEDIQILIKSYLTHISKKGFIKFFILYDTIWNLIYPEMMS